MDKRIKTQISKKVNRKFKKMLKNRTNMSKPDVGNLRQVVLSVLKKRSPVLNRLLPKLNLKTSSKHKEKHFRRWLGKKGLDRDLGRDFLNTVKSNRMKYDYFMVDHSDIIKKYGKMEFIKRIRDGSTGELANGYHVLNVMGVDSTGENMLPVYTDLYSVKEENFKSNNQKVIDGVELLHDHFSRGIFVMDREFDRNVLYEHFMNNGIQFITRLKSQRHLFIDGEETKFKDWRKKTKLTDIIKGYKVHRNGKKKRIKFRAGLKRVKLNIEGYEDKTLYLLVMKKVKRGITRSQGFSYYLAYLPHIPDEESTVIKTISRGYGYRWRIEEYHRFIKQEYDYEAMQFGRYQALKNMNVILLIAMYFVFRGLKNIFINKIRQNFDRKEFERYKIGVYKFIYYELSLLIQDAIYSMNIYERKEERRTRPSANLFTCSGLEEWCA